MKYRKKPVVIDAVQWNGENVDEISVLAAGCDVWATFNDRVAIAIPTPEGVMRASVGDWIIKGVKGELYPCKPDVFEVSYEAVQA